MKFKFEPISNSIVTSKAIGIYALRKLKANFSLRQIFVPIIQNLSKHFFGIKITCRGRFTRKQRASLLIFKNGSNKLATFSKDIDYNFVKIPLKYGVGSLKIWINH